MEERTAAESVIRLFNHEEFGQIRAIVMDGEAWLVGRDVAIALGYQNPAEALQDHVPDKFKRVLSSKDYKQMASNEETSKMLVTFSEESMGGVQRLTFINEAGMYRLIFRSNLPAAEKFSDWACGEVLPNIRKYGYYVAPAVKESKVGFKTLGEVLERSLIEDLRKRRNLLVEECKRLEAIRDEGKMAVVAELKKLIELTDSPETRDSLIQCAAAVLTGKSTYEYIKGDWYQKT